MAGPKPMRTEFGIHHRLESCVSFTHIPYLSLDGIKNHSFFTVVELVVLFWVTLDAFPFRLAMPAKVFQISFSTLSSSCFDKEALHAFAVIAAWHPLGRLHAEIKNLFTVVSY